MNVAPSGATANSSGTVTCASSAVNLGVTNQPYLSSYVTTIGELGVYKTVLDSMSDMLNQMNKYTLRYQFNQLNHRLHILTNVKHHVIMEAYANIPQENLFKEDAIFDDENWLLSNVNIENSFTPLKRTFGVYSFNDGGYYITPKKVLEADILFSGGISSNIEFEYDMFRFNKNITIFMVDPTVSSIRLFSKAILRFLFFKKNKLRYLFNTLIFIYMLRSGRAFHKAKWLSSNYGIIDAIGSDVISLHGKNILLKLDIEGSEYDLLSEIETNKSLFNCMVFEFHDLDKKANELLEFLEKCSNEFTLTHLEINPSGGFSNQGLPKNIEITLEKNK